MHTLTRDGHLIMHRHETYRGLRIHHAGGRNLFFDNAMTESFWSTLKTEFYDRKRWATRDAARKAVAFPDRFDKYL